MKLTGFYYLDYPDSDPPDMTCATTTMYVEIGVDTTPLPEWGGTWSFQVYTQKWVEINYFAHNVPLVGRSILIVPTLDVSWMQEFLTENIDQIPERGEPHGLVNPPPRSSTAER